MMRACRRSYVAWFAAQLFESVLQYSVRKLLYNEYGGMWISSLSASIVSFPIQHCCCVDSFERILHCELIQRCNSCITYDTVAF
jgi:hypothetical protein